MAAQQQCSPRERRPVGSREGRHLRGIKASGKRATELSPMGGEEILLDKRLSLWHTRENGFVKGNRLGV